jgi:transketolase
MMSAPTSSLAAAQESGAALALHIRRRVLELSHRAHVGHIGSCLSVADLVAAVYSAPWYDFGPASLGSPTRDRFVLAKGHAGLALYCALEAIGVLATDELDRFGTNEASLGVHPEAHTPGVDFATGSLGQGLGMATGAALAARITRAPTKVVALLSDAECNAGATWEAVNFAGHHRLAHLVAVVDVNGQQALGATATIQDQEPFGGRWALAGWEVREVDGHDLPALLEAVQPSAGGPVVVVARTTFGAGVSFMERRLDWHYLPMTPEQYRQALAEVTESDAG